MSEWALGPVALTSSCFAVMYEIWPQLLAVWGMMLVASIFYNFVNDTDDGGTDWIPDDAENLYGFLSTVRHMTLSAQARVSRY